MKNANIFVDVDQTLIDTSGKLLAGAVNPLLSTLELILSAVMTLLAVMLPILAFIVLLAMIAGGIWIWRRGRRAAVLATERANAVE